jgi:O-antigen ligase
MSEPATASAPRRQPSLRLILFWQQCDRLSGALLCAMAVFSPWAFGTTTPWAIRVMNFAGYALGGLLALKLFIRWFCNYRPARWGDAPVSRGVWVARALTVALAVLTVVILAYCSVAALNARATYDERSLNFNYREFIRWLPHSYDRDRTWRYFFNYLALALSFWAARDWLLGKTPADHRSARSGETEAAPGVRLPQRLRRLLWLLSLNGALLASEALVQRLSGTEKLLWLIRPRLNAQADAQLGPFNYRSNGAQYLNLIWPVTLGLWWRLGRAVRTLPPKGGWLRRYRHHWLLPCVFVMAATPILSLSRGGAMVTVVNMLAATAVLWFGWRHRSVVPRLGILLFFGLAFGLGIYFGGAKLGARFEEAEDGFNSREEMYDTARRIAQDYPLFGTGPGTLDPVFQPYRKSADEYWPAQLHNDWLETRVTFGWLGSALIGLAFVLVLARCLLPGGVPTGWRLTLLIWVALGGCLLHGRWDFPLQIYSILFLFLLYCAMLTTFSRCTLAS